MTSPTLLPFMDMLPQGAAFAFAFDGVGPAVALPRVADVLGHAQTSGFVWLHLNLADARTREWIAGQDILPEEARETLQSHEDHQRLDHGDDFLWGALSDFHREFDGQGDSIGLLSFVLGARVLITGRRHPLQSVEVLRRVVERGRVLSSPVEVFELIADQVIDAISREVRALTAKIDKIEDRILSDDVSDERKHLGPVRRSVVRLQRQAAGLRAVLQRVEDVPELEQDMVEASSRLAQHVEATAREVHALEQRARLLQDEVAAKLSAETNRNLYTLTILTTLLLPATLVTGAFGMNTKGLPFGDDERGFVLACLIGLAASALVYLFIRRRQTLV